VRGLCEAVPTVECNDWESEVTLLLNNRSLSPTEHCEFENVRAASFEALYQAEYHSVVGLAYVLFGDQGMAEDLAQDAFVETHRRWSSVRHYDNPGAWVRRVLVNKSRSRHRRVVSEAKALTVLAGHRADVIELPERQEAVWRAVRSLPQRQAQVVALRYWDGLTIGEVADVLGCGSETVKTHLKRARATLAAELASERDPPVD
jgi:RNA polymerase sigma-70 factor (ECF subfamily)